MSSSKVPALHLIPTEALLCLADRFQVGTERKGEGAWNALTKNQQCLDDNAFLIERCSHIIRHTMLLRDQLAHGYNPEQEDSPYENAGAIIFGGALMACAMARAKTEMHFSCAMCGCDIPWGTTSCKDCMEYACEAVGMPVGHVPPEKRAEDSTAWVQLDPGGMTGTVIESPDDRVVQDRVPARLGIDYFRWKSWPASCVDKLVHEDTISIGKMHGYVDPDDNDVLSLRCRRRDLPPVESPDDWVVQGRCSYRPDLDEYRYIFRTGPVGGWTKTVSLVHRHGHVDSFGDKLEIRCRRKDLPPIEAPKPVEEEWVDLNQYPDHVLRKEVDWIASETVDDWKPILYLFDMPIKGLKGRYRCLKKDCPYPLPPFMVEAGKYGICRNGLMAGPFTFNPEQNAFYSPGISDIVWNPTGRTMKVDVGMSDEAERGWDIVKLVRE